MADLNDFFAKKDMKKKKKPKAGTKPKPAPVPTEEAPEAVAAPASKKGDDGWIDFADERTAQVNTGGRTIGELRRDAEDKETNGDGEAPVEKFSGWSLNEGADEEDEKEVGSAPAASYPSLADTADAPQVPKNPGPGAGGPTSRPRYGNSGLAAGLRKMLAERRSEGAGAGTGAK